MKKLKKLKKIIKRQGILKDMKLSSIFKIICKKNYYYNKKIVFSIKEVCDFIGISVPKEFDDIKRVPFNKTNLFDELENKEKIFESIVRERKYDIEYFTKQFLNIKNFREKYDYQECFEKDDVMFLKMFIEWYYMYEDYGFNYNDYYDYEIYNKSVSELDGFLNSKYRSRVFIACNDKNYTFPFKNKAEFNKTFSKFISRDWIDATNSSEEEFLKFVKKHPKFFAKPIYGTGGEGAGIKEYKDNFDELYEYCKKYKCICEEVVKQHKDMAKFNKDTLNTLRVYTLVPLNGKPFVTVANARFGRKGNAVDNFHMGGVCTEIDVETGIINTDSINRVHLRFEKHPDSKVVFKGTKIPGWEAVVKAVCEAALYVPEVRHVGWDVAINSDGTAEFIEGNGWPNFDITQAASQVGKKHRYEKYIDELWELRKKNKKKDER